MTKKQYLYGKYLTLDIPQEVIDSKCDALKLHLDELQTVDMIVRDVRRIAKVMAAIEFWQSINTDT